MADSTLGTGLHPLTEALANMHVAICQQRSRKTGK